MYTYLLLAPVMNKRFENRKKVGEFRDELVIDELVIDASISPAQSPVALNSHMNFVIS
jgi:hypothetical protein